ncbi:recombinase family protein, partial [Enterococcus casseliflavus]|uniref:recombinase family protein n=1 Tax=Enterococcus casseliflavus TaxID=37734 RepID=UPI002953A74A
MEDERCDRIYFEKITGTKSNRPEFQKLLQEIQTGDTLVITKLDRFARSTQDALNTIKFLFEKGVKINVLNLGIIENTSTGRLIFTVLLQSSKMNNTSLTLAIVYAGIPNN